MSIKLKAFGAFFLPIVIQSQKFKCRLIDVIARCRQSRGALATVFCMLHKFGNKNVRKTDNIDSRLHSMLSAVNLQEIVRFKTNDVVKVDNI